MRKACFLIAAICLGAPALLAHSAAGTTVFYFSSNPVTLGPGNDVTIYTSTSSVEHPEEVDEGKVVIQMASSTACISPTPVPGAAVVNWCALNAPGQSPIGGLTSLDVDLDALGFVPGAVGGFRAHYVTGGGSDKVETHFSAYVDLQASNDCSGVVIASTLVTGPGSPVPGDGPLTWTFRISTTNCTVQALSNVKIQGGSGGWTDFVSATSTKNPLPSVKANKKNEVITWTGDMAAGETVQIDVTVSGSIPLGAPCAPDPNFPPPGTVQFLSGPWSAAYNLNGPQKAGYTGRVGIVISCP